LLELSGFAYVDDTDLLQINNTVEEVVRNMQKKLDEWNEVIAATGGILSPSKCWWYLVTFEYVAGRWKACSPINNDFHLWIKAESRRRVSIRHVDTTTGMNMLGVCLAPAGNRRDHVEMLRDKAVRWANSMKQSNANLEEVWTALHRTIPYSLCYSLPAVMLTKEECSYAMAPIIRTGLPTAGFVSTIPVAIRSGSISDGGLGIIDLYLHMGVSRIEALVSHLWQRTPTGHLLEVVLDDLGLELGLSKDPWHPDQLSKSLQYTTAHTWIHHTLQFALDHNIFIHLQDPHLPPNREHDYTIMEKVLESIQDKKILQSINRIRMELKLVWMSEMTVANGRTIDRRYLHTAATTFPRNKYRWPLQHHTSKADWQTWRRWIRTITRNNDMALQDPLGAWTCKRTDWILYWDCFVTSTMEILYIRMGDHQGWSRHIVKPGRQHRNLRFHKDSLHCRYLTEDPEYLFRATIQTHRDYLEVSAMEGPPQQLRPHIQDSHQLWLPFPAEKH
jgi:hypothetical protein